MAEETWHEARLIPTSGISGAEEQERRATSALLAVIGSVKEFGKALLAPLGAHSGHVTTYIEVPFQLGDKRVYPDGLIRVTRGSRVWTALVEVKTGKNELEAEQLESYLDVARDQGFDALITISNEIPAIVGQHPTKIDGRKTRKVRLFHLSWAMVLSVAVVQKEHRGVSDPDQAWILGELIRYLEHPRSGALEFEDMGPTWVPVRQAVTAGTLRKGDKAAPEVVARFDALLRYTALRLGRQLGTEVTHVLSRKEVADPAVRTEALLDSLVARGTLFGAIRIPNTVGPVQVSADLRAGQVACHVDIDAPKQGRPTTRINWLVRQLKSAPGNVRIEAFLANARGDGAADLLDVVRENPQVLVTDTRRELRSFRVAMTCAMGTKRSRGRGSFIDSVIDIVDTFYADIVQHLKAWSAAPPRMRESEQPAPPPKALSSTALSSQDGPEPVGTISPDRSALPGGSTNSRGNSQPPATPSEESSSKPGWVKVSRESAAGSPSPPL